MPTSINNTIACNEPHASLDVYYGPYDSVAAALEALKDVTIAGVTYHKKHVGLTVGVWENSNTIKEYWFQGGTSAADFVEKKNGGGLPENIKLVMFDKNGATGTQNSILTDNDSKVCLPEPTITLSGCTFAGWLYGSSTYEPGATVTIGTDTTIQAQWSSVTQTRIITWTFDANKFLDVTGVDTSASRNINSGDEVAVGHNVRLSARLKSNYEFAGWTGSITSNDNPLNFSVGGSNIIVTANARAVEQKYTVSWTNGNHISISGTYNNGGSIIPITSGVTQIPAGSRVVLTATPDSGYAFSQWTGVPSGVTPLGNTLTIQLNSNVSGISATATAINYKISWAARNVTVDCSADTPTGETIENIVSGVTPIPANSNVTMIANYDSTQYTFDGWTGLPDGDSQDTRVAFILQNNVSGISVSATPISAETYTVSWRDENYTTISGRYSGVGASGDIENGVTQIPAGSTVVLTATPDSGYIFSEWTGVPSGVTPVGNTLAFTLNSDVSGITGVSVRGYTVTWRNDDGINTIAGTADGVGITSGETLIRSGANIVLEATLNPGYDFYKWEGENIPTGTTLDNPTLSFTLSTRNVTANATTVAAQEMYVVKWKSAESGEYTIKCVATTPTGETIENIVSGRTQIPVDSVVTLSIILEDGYTITGWSNKPTDSQVIDDGKGLLFRLQENTEVITPLVTSDGYTIEWDESGRESVNITRIDGIVSRGGIDVTIHTGDRVSREETVRLKAVVMDECDFETFIWQNAPSGLDLTQSMIEFTPTASVSGITAKAVQHAGTMCTVRTHSGTGVSSIAVTDGQGNPLINNQIAVGQTIKMQATLSEGYEFTEWTGTGIPTGTTVNEKILTFEVASDIDVTANAERSRKTVVNFSPGEGTSGIECWDRTANVSVNNGDRVLSTHQIQLEATVNDGYVFSEWIGLPSGVSTDTNPTPQFAVGENELTIKSVGVRGYKVSWVDDDHAQVSGLANGNPIESSGLSFASGTTIKLTASVDEGYSFVRWSGLQVEDATQNPVTFELTEDVVEATPVVTGETPTTTYSVEWSHDENIDTVKGFRGGDIVESGTFESGTELTLVAEPTEGYTVDWRWDGYPQEGEYTIDSETGSIVMSVYGNISIKAVGAPVARKGFYYCGSDDGNIPENTEKFEYVDGTEKSIDSGNSFEALFVVIPNDSYVVKCIVEGVEVELTGISGYRDQYEQFVGKGWVVEGSDLIAGSLATQCSGFTTMRAYVGYDLKSKDFKITVQDKE